jgi:hypothetical protein
MRCSRCHHILPPETRRGHFCPTCYREDGVTHFEKTKTNIIDVSFALYRCEECGLMVRAG